MTKYRFTVEVECSSQDEADTVMTERIGYDEDYGFQYTIDLLEIPEHKYFTDPQLGRETWKTT